MEHRTISIPGPALFALLCLLGASACRRASPSAADASASQVTPSPSASSAALLADAAPPDPCRIVGARQPLLVRWTSGQRAVLEEVMRSGIAVVAADDCRGMRVLAGCHARGHYGYLGVELATYPVDLGTEEELRINAPLAAAAPGVDAGPIAPPPLHASVSLVGRRATTRNLLSPQELSGDCDGATHFVQSEEIGEALVTAKADAGSGSAACRAAHPGDTSPPAGCEDVVLVSLNPIADLGELVTFDKAPADTVSAIGTCPEGMVVASQRCTRPPVDGPYLCAFGDAAGCRAQCDRGDINSCDVLGFMLWHGKGVAADLAQAAAVYTRACDHADRIACANLGVFLFRGDGVPRDQVRAVTLLQRACSLGDAEACADVGQATIGGEGIAPDATRGMALLQRACDAGSAHACSQVAKRLGGDAGADAARGHAMFEELCDGDNGTSCAELARGLFLGEGATIDRARAATLFSKACRCGDDHSCIMLGLQYRQAEGVAKDDVLATQLMERACGHGEAEGCLDLGIAYENGKGVEADAAHAAKLYEQACNADIGRACAFLADLRGAGTGVPKDVKAAGELYRRACQLGEKEACARAQ